MQRQLDHDLTLREFLIVKGQRRILRDLEEKERRKKEFEIQNLENQLRLYEDTLKQIQVVDHNIHCPKFFLICGVNLMVSI